MNGRRFSLVLLLALAGCALVAQGAVAQVGTKSTNTTAVVCVKGGEEDFKDAHCDESVGAENGEYGHKAIGNGETTETEVTQEGTSTFTFELGPVQVACKKAVTVKGKSFIHNVETEGKHTATGTIQLNFSECEVKNLKGCTAIEPITFTASFEGVEKLNEAKNEMGLELKGEGKEGTFAEIAWGSKAPEKCGVVTSFLVRGSMIATGGTEIQSEEQSGSTLVFEDANSMETLVFAAKTVSFAGTFTPSMSGGGNPISLTTVT
jgi:hypothetical protein